MDRLFRSTHFTKIPGSKDMPTYTLRQQQILYGRHTPYERCYYYANSPLMAEIIRVSRDSKELLWIGDLKYMGYVFAEVLVCLIDLTNFYYRSIIILVRASICRV